MSNRRTSAGIIFNPVAGRARAPEIAAKLERHLDRLGLRCELFATARAGHARELAATYASEFDALAAIGGDGTINEILNGLADKDSETPLAIIPGGTANVISRELGLPRSLSALAGLLAESATRRIDLAEANGRRFALCCGAGLDARIVHEISRWRGKGGIHMLHYAKPLLRELLSPQHDRICIRADGKLLEGSFSYVVAGNFNRYAGPFRLFHGARPDDGLLNVFAYRGTGIGSLVRLGLRALVDRVHENRDVVLLTAREVEFLPADTPASSATYPEPAPAERPIALQIDGDAAGFLPVRMQMLPAAVNFCVPAKSS